MKPIAFLIPALIVAGPLAAQPMTPAQYVAKAGASDLFEKTSSQIVLQSSKDDKVRGFAQQMIDEHTKSTADIKAAAMQSGIKPMPPKLDAAQTKMIAQLRAARGMARDTAYIAQQKTSHDQALAAQQAYAADGTAPALKQAAATIVPVVQQHIQMLATM